MANDYKSQRVKQTSVADILNLLNSFQQRQNTVSKSRNFIFDEYSKGASSFNNEEVEMNYNNMKNYYNENVSTFTSEEIDKYNILKDKYDAQIKVNNKFSADNERRFSFGKGIYNFADEYSNANDARSFSYKKSVINDKGAMVDEDVIVSLPNPDDYFDGVDDDEFHSDNDEALKALGGVEGYVKKKEEYKKHLKNEAMKQIGAYSDYQGQMIQDYGGSGRLTNFHLKEFQELDESYGFIIDSLEDDGIFDSEERDVYKSSILSKSSNPITQYVAKDEEIKNTRRGVLLKEMQSLKTAGDTYADDLDSVLKSSLDMDANQLLETAITIPKNTSYNSTDKDVSYTYQDLKSLDNNPELAGHVSSLQTNIASVKKELKNKDTAYMKNDGGSFLAGMEEETWTSGLHETTQGFVPKMYGDITKKGLPSLSSSEAVSQELNTENINLINASSEISEIDPKYQKGGQYSSGGKKLEKEIKKLNENVEGLANKPIKGNKTSVGSVTFMPGNSIENFYNWPKGSGGLGKGIGFGKMFNVGKVPEGGYTAEAIPGLKEMTGKDHKDGDFIAEDLLKIEEQYNNDIKEKEKLVNQYKSLRSSGVDKNLPEMLTLQNQINVIYQRWFGRKETDFGTLQEFKIHPGKAIQRDWNLALEESGSYRIEATELYKFMDFLRLRFDEEKQKVKEQTNKVKKIKKNLS